MLVNYLKNVWISKPENRRSHGEINTVHLQQAFENTFALSMGFLGQVLENV